MHPKNVDILKAARIDACSLANNHVLDWGYEGLEETLSTLHRSNIAVVGAGHDISEAEGIAILTNRTTPHSRGTLRLQVKFYPNASVSILQLRAYFTHYCYCPVYFYYEVHVHCILMHPAIHTLYPIIHVYVI